MEIIEKRLKKQLKIEKKSIVLYNSFIRKIRDARIRKKVAGVRDDEKEHVLLVKKMISFLK